MSTPTRYIMSCTWDGFTRAQTSLAFSKWLIDAPGTCISWMTWKRCFWSSCETTYSTNTQHTTIPCYREWRPSIRSIWGSSSLCIVDTSRQSSSRPATWTQMMSFRRHRLSLQCGGRRRASILMWSQSKSCRTALVLWLTMSIPHRRKTSLSSLFTITGSIISWRR